MIFNLVDWLENEVPGIIENPGRLRDISAAASGYSETQQSPHRVQSRKRPAQTDLNRRKPQHADVLNRWQAKQATPQQVKMLNTRMSLPAWKLRDEIVKAVNSHQVTIISGETGSGKSTQSVQFILDDMIQRQFGASANIVCTQAAQDISLRPRGPSQ